MGVEKHETIFVGDHPIDARCAVNAGVTFIGVLTGDVPEDVLKAEGSAMVFADISELRHWLEESLQ
jgi:phosphoglycolate phosphatase-like HAD superfamily hydrolase